MLSREVAILYLLILTIWQTNSNCTEILDKGIKACSCYTLKHQSSVCPAGFLTD